MCDTRKTGNAKREGKSGSRKVRRLTCLLLCLCMVMPMFPVFRGLLSDAHAVGATEHIVENSRVADPDTMDDYVNQLLNMANGSRYAGRVWTDKSVFAYGNDDEQDWIGNALSLHMETDGYDGSVDFDADFGHVFSALASSQVVNEFPPSPIDLVIVFDMSASMGQDTRFGIDGGSNAFQKHSGDGWPAEGVLMADRIENSRIQQTLDAINKTIDKLMEQNPENRVAVCCYGANATVILPLAHYMHAKGADGTPDKEIPFLKVGGMETLYYPGDLVWRDTGDSVNGKTIENEGWYWVNNRDTCYTVEANALMNENVDDCSMKELSNVDDYEPYTTVISNNVNSDNVKAFPGAANPAEINRVSDTIKANSKTINNNGNGTTDYGPRTDNLIKAVAETEELHADDYVGYFTNTQGGIYLAYKQLADSKATTYTDMLSNGTKNTVARIPAAIIMSDGGANFAFNNMGGTVDDWNKRYGAKKDDSVDNPTDLSSYYLSDDTYGPNGVHYTIREEDYKHRLGGHDTGENPGNTGDEWYNVYLPGDDTLLPGTPGTTTETGRWDGLHTLYNLGADYYQDGTLQTPPVWDRPGVLYANDDDWQGTPATVLEVLLTASYMNQVVKKHYESGWDDKNVLPDSKAPMSTYTMNVDTKNVPQWGRWRLFPTLDPKDYPPDDLANQVNNDPRDFADQYGATYWTGSGWDNYQSIVFGAVVREWGALKANKKTNPYVSMAGGAQAAAGGIAAKLDMTAQSAYTYRSGETVISVTPDEILDNVAYNKDFFDVTSDQVDVSFERILSEITGTVFTPISGDNDAGVGNSITYQDPIGDYMEIKNQSLKTTVHDSSAPATYDMALLVFGKMHGLVRAGVYDYQWNDDYMSVPEHHAGTHGETAFPMGWYKGENGKTGEKAEENPETGLPVGCATAEEAWAAGWVYRFNFKTLLSYVPIVGAPDDGMPNNLSDQVKNTVYTCYRFAGSKTERNKLRRNPIYGEEIPDELAAKWGNYEKTGDYPEGNGDYANVPGVYRLSDIRVWIEDTGDYIDTEGAIAPNSGYNRSLYLNIPAAAVPTQLATITLGRDGVLSYLTNLATDKGLDYGELRNVTEEDKERFALKAQYEAYSAQSTPLRLFYAVGLEEDLILRDDTPQHNQIGVDFSKISAEYISSHTVEGQDYVWFISNFYSGTNYTDYVTDTATARTRGDPTMTFSPSAENRYYVFQKPLPLYAHAYRATADGALKPVDNADGVWSDTDNQNGGNGATKWENDATGGGQWTGGEYMGTYASEEDFRRAKETLTVKDGKQYITDGKGVQYLYVENGIVFLERDLMDHVTSKADGSGFESGSVAFNSEDYFFLLVEYYLPEGDVNSGHDDQGHTVPDSYGGRMVQRAVARRGSEFGSGFASDNIDNGDMLCWTDMSHAIDLELDYLSKSETGDLTRGEPTFEKLTQTGDELRKYLRDTCKISSAVQVPDPDNPENQISALEQQVKYWQTVQENAQVRAALESAREKAASEGGLNASNFNDYFQFAVSARPGGIRSGDMSNNRHAKTDNATGTANNYYVPTVSDNSGTDDDIILNNYMGNNGRLEIANQMLHVTKLLEPPAGFALSEEQKDEEFNYQIYVQGVTGTRSAMLTQYNEYGKVWERRLAYIDVLTDNSDLVLDNSSRRALFDVSVVNGRETARQVVTNDAGAYVYADDDGNPTEEICAAKDLYYMYLPSNGTGGGAAHTRRLYQDPQYDGTADGYTSSNAFDKNGRTTFFAPGAREETTEEPGAPNRNSYRDSSKYANRPAGTRTYWAMDAELIPVSEVQAMEATDETLESEPGGISVLALESVGGGAWIHGDSCTAEHKHLQFYTFVIRKPNNETSETNFSSPFMTRSLYMTVTLEFGKNANRNDGGAAAGTALTKDDVYDQILPSADRPDLFGDKELKDIAANTAEFTLKHGEGLLLSGLDNRVAYRFTEKLTAEQLAKGYALKRISHIQQRGSESIYVPGVQKIPVYTRENSKYGSEYGTVAKDRQIENDLTWALNADGTKNTDATLRYEPFAHTNAVMWEYYATMEAGASGNHHQPKDAAPEVEANTQVWNGSPNTYVGTGQPHTVKTNPSCTEADSVDGLQYGVCDLTQPDGTILHYMYRNGELLDPHYNGEASTYLRNMARYGVSPTVHFGVKGETTESPATEPASGYYDYDGVYSVYGNTGWFEEQANYVNTWNPDALTVSKELVGESGTPIDGRDRDVAFSYTVTFTLPEWLTNPDHDEAANALKNLPYWKGKTADRDKATTEGGAPRPLDLAEIDALAQKHRENAEPEFLTPDETGAYTFTLKADESVVLYGLPIGTAYTVRETRDPDYPLQGETDESDSRYAATGTIEKSDAGIVGTVIANQVTYVNEKPEPESGSLTVEKRVTDDDAETVDKTFTFKVALTPLTAKDDLEATKYDKNDRKIEDFSLDWTPDETGGLTATFSLRHGEKVVINGIPLGTNYTVAETDRDGYHLEYVTDTASEPKTYIHPEDFGVRGTIDETTPHVYWLFANAKPADLPFSGSFGVWQFWGIGAALLLAAVAVCVIRRRKRGKRVI